MEDMIKMLAQAPPEQRTAMMKERMQMFLEMQEEKRVEAIAGLVKALGDLKPAQREELIKGRTMLMASFPEKERTQLAAARMKAGQKLPKAVHESDMQITQKVAMELPDDLKKNFAQTMEKLQKEMGATMPAPAAKAGGPPTHHDRPMVRKGVFQKNWVCQVCGYKVPA